MATDGTIRLWLEFIAYQGLHCNDLAFLEAEQVDFDATPPVLIFKSPKESKNKSMVLHPDVVVTFQSLRLPDRGRLFPDLSPQRISRLLGAYCHASGASGTAINLVAWYRQQVQEKGRNFGRSPLTGSALTELGPVENLLIEALEGQVPSAALSYRQAVLDLNDENRLSFRGVANELRSVVWDVLEKLAPDDLVTAQSDFRFEEGQSQPTQKQRARFILKSRRMGNTARRPPETTLTMIDEQIGRASCRERV